MSPSGQTLKDRKSLLDQHLTEATLFIKQQCPDAEVEVSQTSYEDEDAHILVFPPASFSEEAREKLADACAEKSIRILLETGLLILIGVYEPSQRP